MVKSQKIYPKIWLKMDWLVFGVFLLLLGKEARSWDLANLSIKWWDCEDYPQPIGLEYVLGLVILLAATRIKASKAYYVTPSPVSTKKPLVGNLTRNLIGPSKPHKFPLKASCAWFMNQIKYIFSKKISYLVKSFRSLEVWLWSP